MTHTSNLNGSSQSNKSDGAVLYDYLQVYGGAEKVTLDIASEYSADIIVGFNNLLSDSDFMVSDQSSKIISLNGNSNFLPWQIYKLHRAFSQRTKFLRQYKWAIYSGNFAPLAIDNHAQSNNLLYCHNIPRFVYDLNYYYKQRYSGLKSIPFNYYSSFFKEKYEESFHKMDHIIANSENVRSRIRRYLKTESIVIHPPCDIEAYKWVCQDNYYISTARLEPYKRVDLIIQAFKQLPNTNLIVASNGSDLNRLKSIAGASKNISFTGWLDNHTLKRLVGSSIATIYIPIDEDFGMSPVESMAAGKPVIGVAKGGLLETVVSDKTGLLISPESSVEEIISAVQEMSSSRALSMRNDCELRSRIFSHDAFFSKLDTLLPR